jgi:hypothetical protein
MLCNLANGTGGGLVSDAMLTLVCERSGCGAFLLLRNRDANVGSAGPGAESSFFSNPLSFRNRPHRAPFTSQLLSLYLSLLNCLLSPHQLPQISLTAAILPPETECRGFAGEAAAQLGDAGLVGLLLAVGNGYGGLDGLVRD